MLTIEQIGIEVGRVVRFGMVGVASAVIYFIVTVIFVKAGLAPIGATLVGFAFATCVSYFGHQQFSFAVEPNHRAFISRFAIITAASLAVNVGITWLFTEVIGVSYLFSIAAVTVLVPIANYFGNRFWVFLPGLRSVAASDAPEVAQLLSPVPAPRGPPATSIADQSNMSS
jgi:putative flippase GtrA